MKNFTTSKSSKISVVTDGKKQEADLYSDEGFEMLATLTTKSGVYKRKMYELDWLGVKCIQIPNDIVAMQEIIWSVKPDIIVETGVAHGGSLILSASVLELIGKGKVVGVDVDIREHNRKTLDAHPLRHRLELVEGSSIDNHTAEQVKSYIGPGDIVLVVLDSNHTEAHVSKEIEIYSELVSIGSYIVVHDGSQAYVSDIPGGKPEWEYDHPLTSIRKFLAENKNFEIDAKMNRWGATSSPDGYLKRVK